MTIPSFERFHQRLREKEDDVRARPVTYVAFGDSVTQGCMQYATIEHEEVYPQLFRRIAEQRYPRTIVNVINSGVSADTVKQSEERWERDIFAYDPDLISIGFGVNDAHVGEEGLPDYVDGIKRLIDGIRRRTKADIVLLTPNMMIMQDNVHVHEKDRPAIPKFLRTYEAGHLQRYTETLRNLAEELELPLVDVYARFEQLLAEGKDIHSRLANGINHPDTAFHRLIADDLGRIVLGD